ncbi:MAG: polyphosphate kinase 2 family protein [Chloroflexi bacterium]|nr:polyphosphate kinase 2 family protein [Chloroflexota bacterium]
MKTEDYLVVPGSAISLADFKTDDTAGHKKSEALARLEELRADLNTLQQLLYADGRYGLLVILQGMDTSGKDGVCRHVVNAFNPQGVQITSFKVPTSEELAHDFLWRIHKAIPRRGMVGIFNRSQYEDVLVVRVENLVPEKVWRKRYGLINDFEGCLCDNGITVVKFFLHISNDEQKTRLQDRLDDPTEYWKFNLADLKTRAKWDAYTAAYEDALNKCSTKRAPWYIIPADKKWFRDLLISQILKEKLTALNLEWPPLAEEAVGITIE